MLKRNQILLTDWQENYIKFVAELCDTSFSETVRMMLSAWFVHIVPILSPTYKPDINQKEFLKIIKSLADCSFEETEKHSFISKLYFEARKATEYRTKNFLKKKKNKI